MPHLTGERPEVPGTRGRNTTVWLAWAILLSCACGSSRPHEAKPVPTVPDDAGQERQVDALSDSHPPEDAGAAPLSNDECATLVDHVVRLVTSDLRQRVEASAIPGQATLDDIRARMRDEFQPICRTLSRDSFRCVMAAGSQPEYEACAR